MTKRPLLAVCLAMAACAALPGAAAGDGLMMTGAATGVSVAGSPHRYVALTSGPNRVTVVARIDRRGGEVGRWWYLRGTHYVPAVAYDRSAGGLSADGRTLVLTKFVPEYPQRTSRFAVVRTNLHLRHSRQAREDQPRPAIAHLKLPGSFGFDAISPDGSTIYLIHNFLRRGRPVGYEVRAVETATGRLLPRPIVDPEEPDERMQGLPVTREASPDGRWAYTLYDGQGKEPFIHALDTVEGRAVCVDLPQLEDVRDPFLLRMRPAESGHRLLVFSRSRVQGGRPSPTLLAVDTRSFTVQRPEAKSSGSGSGVPLLPIGAVVALCAAAAIWLLARRQRAPRRPSLEQR